MRLQDIASQAGVSAATVSRLLNNPEMVSDKRRAEILKAMDLLGCDRPPALQESAETRIGIVLPELTNPIFAATAHQLSSLISHLGAIAMITSQSPGAASEPALVRALLASKASGLIMVSGRHADANSSGEAYAHLRERQVPFVTINGPVSGAPAANTDEDVTMDLAVGHLVELGHERIALINGSKRFYPARAKSIGFERAIEKYRLNSAHCPELETQYGVEGGAQGGLAAVSAGATGLVFASDLMATGALQTLRLAGYSIPNDVSIIGFDGTELGTHLNPPLTTVRQSLLPLCAHAVNQLMALIGGEKVAPISTCFAPELVIRASTAPLAKK